MMDEPIALGEQDYRELAAFLEEQLPLCQTRDESDELRRRLAQVYVGFLKEPARATCHHDELLGEIEAAIAKDPSDDELRQRYVERARSSAAPLRAAETLGRALKKIKASGVRERVGFDIGTIYLQQGEHRPARGAFLEVILVGAGGPLAISAARHLLDPELHAGDAQVIGAALETIARFDGEPQARREAAERLLSLHESKPLKESRLLVAYQGLLDSPRADEALLWLRSYYERKGDQGALSEVYRRQAVSATDPAAARALALRSIELGHVEGDQERIDQWLWFLTEFGPDPHIHANLIPLLERAQRWDDLCKVLEADVELATPEQRAPRMARIGQMRLDVLADVQGALSAFRRCLSLDPWNELARSTVERLMAEGEWRLAAADVLEPVYRIAKFHDGELRVLETRSELLADPGARLAALAAAVDISKGKLNDARRALHLCERGLREAFAFAGDAVLDWVVRLERVAALAQKPETQAAILLGLLGDHPVDSPERVALAVSAVDALVAAGASDQALAVCERGLSSDASSPELLRRVDALLSEKEAPRDRLARYEAALRATTDGERRHVLMHTMAGIQRDSLGDVVGAIAVLRSIVAENPKDFAAYESLIEATAQRGDLGGAIECIDRARRSFRDARRNRLTLRKAQLLVAMGDSDRAIELCGALLDKPDLAAPILRGIAQLASARDEQVLYGRALKSLIGSDEVTVKKEALEQYAEFLFETVGNPGAAAECWKAAAEIAGEDPALQDRARALYERALAVQPDDFQAASRLVELHAGAGDWARIPGALQPLLGGGDVGRCVELLLRLETSAVEARAFDEFLSPIHQLIRRLEAADADQVPGVREQVHALCRARARVLARDPARHRQASVAFRGLVEAFESEDDVRDYASHVDASTDAGERHEDRRWLYRWRATRSALPAEVLLEWGKAEEAHGDLEAAIEVYQRLADVDGARKVALEALVRLKLETGDFAEIELIAEGLDAPSTLGVFDSLLTITARSETGLASAEIESARQRWLERIIALAPADRPTALAAVVRGAVERPENVALWAFAERLARDLGAMQTVARAYHDVLVEATEPSLAETLGQRMIAFEEECALDAPQLIEALDRVLQLLPGARWALDRIKLALGTLGRYGDLFNLFDRAIDASPDEQRRGELLHEAASAARDLAADPRRAIAYFESLRALRPDDAAVDGALERLYEKQGQTVDLIELLSRRLERASGFQRRDLCRRITSLWLDLGDVEKAGALVEHMLRGNASVVDVADLLERIVQQPSSPAPPGRKRGAASVHERAIERLRSHYESIGRARDVVRIAARSLALATSSDQRARCARELVGLELRAAAAEGVPRVFEQVLSRLDTYSNGQPRIAKVASKALLIHAIRALRAGGDTDARADAEDGAWSAIQALLSLSMESGEVAAALRLMNRCARLPLERGRRRELLGTAAFVCSEYIRDSERAIQFFARLFEEDAGDEIASKSVDRYAKLLETAGRHADLANVWERQADVHGRGGNEEAERSSWQRAAQLWEREGAADQAIHAHRRAAALGGEASFEALARIHAGRREWADAVRALEWLYAHAPPGSRGRRALRLAEACVELGDRARARACLEDALRTPADTEDPEPTRGRLIELYREDQVWRPLAQILSAQADTVGDPARKLDSLREAADLHWHRLDEPEEAAALLEQAVSLDPHDNALRASLIDVLEALGQWDRTVAVLRGQIDLHGDHRSKDRALTHHRLARTLATANRPEEALHELRVAAEMHPTHPAILFDLARLALEREELDLAEQTYRALLLAIHRPTEAPAAPSRSSIFADLSEIASRRGDVPRAADLMDSALDEAVERGEDPRRLEAGLRERGRNDLLARALERRVQRGATLTERAVALGDLARLWGEALGRAPELGVRIVEHAERIARDLAHEERTDASAWIALASAYAISGNKGQLAEILASAIPRVEPGTERSRLRVVLARFLIGEPGREDAAVHELSTALAEEPAGREATELLSEVLERQGRFDALVAVLEKRVRALSESGESAEVLDATWRYGRALELAGHNSNAVSVYESLLDRPLTGREVARSLANRLQELGSERVGDSLEQWMALDEDAAAEIAKRLVALRESQGDTAAVIRALERGFAAQPQDPELRDRLVKVYEQGAEWDHAARVLGRAVAALPGERQLLLRLVDARRRAGKDAETLADLDVALAARPDDAELLVVRASLRERISDPEGALADLERASTLNPAHLGALTELFGRMSTTGDSSASAAHTIRVVDVLMRVHRPKQARRELERLLSRSPDHREALGRLASIAAAEGNWKSAADIYRKLLGVVEPSGSPEELVRVAAATAEACERSGMLGEVRETLAPILDAVAGRVEISPELERLCQAMKDWPRLAAILIGRAEQEERADAKADLLVHAGAILLDEAGDPTNAIPLLDQALSARPDRVDGRLLWARAQVALGNAREALRLLYDTLEPDRGKRSPKLSSIYVEIGKAHLALDELPEALSALESGFSADWRTGDVAMLLGQVALDLGEDKTAERAFSAAATLPPRKGAAGARADAAVKATAYCHLAEIAMRKGDLAKARRLADKALAGEPENAAARALLESLESKGDSVGAVAK